MNNEIAISDTPAEGRSIDLASHAVQLLVVCAVALVGNWVATKVSPLEALPGMACLYAMTIVGLVIAKYMPFYLPSVAWISLVAIIATIPGVPGAAFVNEAVGKLNFLAMATPALAYAGLALTKNEFTIARKSGWKIVVVAICVMFGTYIGSVVIADLVLRITG
ncbi:MULTISPECIES: hypothetical protein [unclassified Chelatococcus]|uniref:hypothetical protein n=1 Tax=unclassified Chelatococcus TaxID=2638111 RepID=UPI00030EEC99|nr:MULTISPECIES: hypothetical protein [unclassified Chelatococcus]ALA20189.1 hypothetical protein AL346_22430 [Chelatococcus sp. CO-6]